ncbi:MAG: hypothetical protein IIB19_02910, partial [Chloroflexi bacterium]|nr:hypothetical protein [Chloroflexota bacterium]
MLRPISVIDVPSLLWLRANALPNPARTVATLAHTPSPALPLASLLSEWLPGRTGQHTWVWPRRGVASGVVSLKRRSGRSSWEVNCLLVHKRTPDAAVGMLEEAGVSVALRGAERVLLRIPQKCPLELPARQAGFKPYYGETVFVRSPGASLSMMAASLSATDNGCEPGDLAPYDLFRLYLRIVPPEAREPLGITFQQWLDSREGLRGQQASFVQRRDGDVSGWASLVMRGK